MLITLDQRSDDWHDWRNDAGDGLPRITATKAITLGGLNLYKSAWREIVEMLGLVKEEDLSNNPLVQQGIALEEEGILWLSSQKGLSLQTGFVFQSDEYCEFGASPDSVDFDANGKVNYIGEIKVPSRKTLDEVVDLKKQSAAFQMYSAQVIWQIGSCSLEDARNGFLHADICFYDHESPENSLILDVEFDEVLYEQMVEASIRYRQAVALGVIPSELYPDFYIPTEEEADKMWQEFAFEVYALKEQEDELSAQMKNIKTRKDEIRDQLVALMGANDKGFAYGVQVTRFSSQGAVDWKEVVKQLDNNFDERKYETFRKAGNTITRMTVKK